jgi:hypothetical protein
MKRTASLVLLVTAGVAACADPVTSTPDSIEPAFAGAPVRQEMQFSATALCGPDTGENIAFGGWIINQTHETRDARGKRHAHRVFTAGSMTGTGALSGTQYDVRGGAEMFSWQYDANGAVRILIHQGTLVFAAEDHQIIARHVIRNTPGPQATINTWSCQRVAG